MGLNNIGERVAANFAAKKGEVPEAFKKQWKNKDRDNDGKEGEGMPEGLKKHFEEKGKKAGWQDVELIDADILLALGKAGIKMNNIKTFWTKGDRTYVETNLDLVISSKDIAYLEREGLIGVIADKPTLAFKKK
jgi:hypothetical protein